MQKKKRRFRKEVKLKKLMQKLSVAEFIENIEIKISLLMMNLILL